MGKLYFWAIIAVRLAEFAVHADKFYVCAFSATRSKEGNTAKSGIKKGRIKPVTALDFLDHLDLDTSQTGYFILFFWKNVL